MYDLPPTTREFAEKAKRAAKDAGLNTVHIGNQHLLK
jgi:pyruvate-formate lyase-activating enzyme